MGRKKHIVVYEKRICGECGEEFVVDKRIEKIFCKRSCSSKNVGKRNKGRKFSAEVNKKKGLPGELNAFYGRVHKKESKDKIAKANKGRKFSAEVNKKKGLPGELNAFYGRKHTSESRAKISENHRDCKGEKNPMFGEGEKIKGEKNGSWKGGISVNEYGEEFNEDLKTKIRKRDKFRCAICKKNGYDVHHVDYNKKNNVEENLITLCRSDHAKTNFNRDSWELYFKNYILNEYEK